MAAWPSRPIADLAVTSRIYWCCQCVYLPHFFSSVTYSIAEIENERLRHIRLHERVNELPDPNYATLKYFLGHLQRFVVLFMRLTSLNFIPGSTNTQTRTKCLCRTSLLFSGRLYLDRLPLLVSRMAVSSLTRHCRIRQVIKQHIQWLFITWTTGGRDHSQTLCRYIHWWIWRLRNFLICFSF